MKVFQGSDLTSANVGESKLKQKQLNIIWVVGFFWRSFIMHFVIFLCSASVCCYLCIQLPVGMWQPLPGIGWQWLLPALVWPWNRGESWSLSCAAWWKHYLNRVLSKHLLPCFCHHRLCVCMCVCVFKEICIGRQDCRETCRAIPQFEVHRTGGNAAFHFKWTCLEWSLVWVGPILV